MRVDQKIVIRPRVWSILLTVILLLLLLGHIFIAATLRRTDTGVNLQSIDTYSFAFIGLLWVVLAAAIFSFKVTVTAEGLIVKNFWPTNKVITWSDIKNISFPVEKNWPQLELNFDEYVPIMAIQRMDKAYAASSFKLIESQINQHKQ